MYTTHAPLAPRTSDRPCCAAFPLLLGAHGLQLPIRWLELCLQSRTIKYTFICMCNVYIYILYEKMRRTPSPYANAQSNVYYMCGMVCTAYSLNRTWSEIEREMRACLWSSVVRERTLLFSYVNQISTYERYVRTPASVHNIFAYEDGFDDGGRKKKTENRTNV